MFKNNILNVEKVILLAQLWLVLRTNLHQEAVHVLDIYNGEFR